MDDDREGTDWIHDGVDFVQHWILSDQNRRLATHTIYTRDDPPEVTMRVIELLGGSS
jgi:hypothetical protein